MDKTEWKNEGGGRKENEVNDGYSSRGGGRETIVCEADLYISSLFPW